jgi:hypothetical protein
MSDTHSEPLPKEGSESESVTMHFKGDCFESSAGHKCDNKHCCEKKDARLSTFIITDSTAGLIVPSGARYANVLLVGAGGGGGAGGDGSPNIPLIGGGGGGGGGTYINKDLSVCPGELLNVVIGMGGEGGSSVGKNGEDGGNTYLTRSEHSCKVEANGGQGGQGAFNGGLGGAGGAGTGCGDKGDDGFSNANSTIPGQQIYGGNGGLSGLVCPSSYGNGGHGADAVATVTVLNTTLSSVGSSVDTSSSSASSSGTQSILNLLLPFEIYGHRKPPPHNSRPTTTTSTAGASISSDVKITTSPATVSVSVPAIVARPAASNLNPDHYMAPSNCMPSECCNTTTSFYTTTPMGTDGYAKIEIFGDPCDKKPLPRNKITEIVPFDNTSNYLVDPNCDLCLVDTTNFSVNLKLGKPADCYKRLTVKLLEQKGLDAFLMPFSGGTFHLSAENPSVTLLYDNGVWSILEDIESIMSFYPTKQEGPTLTPSNGFNPSPFGFGVTAISADGSTIAISNWADNNQAGAVWIYTLADDHWSQRAKLLPTGSVSGSPLNFGVSVSLSADGTVLSVGAPGDNNNQGAVYIFEYRDCSWVQTARLVNAAGVAGYLFGLSQQLSADGNTLIVGEFSNLPDGGAWVFYRQPIISSCMTCGGATNCPASGNPNPWIQQQHLVGIPGSSGGQGYTVAINAEGDTIAIFAFYLETVYIFTLGSNNIWAQQGPPLTGVSGSNFGYSLSFSADGNTLAVGAPNFGSIGAAFVYTRYLGVWSQQSLPLSSPAPGFVAEGISVSLSADGNTLAVGGVVGLGGSGNTWIYTRVDNIWSAATTLVAGVIGHYVLNGAFASLNSDASIMATGTIVSSTTPTLTIYV